MSKICRFAVIALLAASAQAQTEQIIDLLKAADQHRQRYGGKYRVVLSPSDSIPESRLDTIAVRKAGFDVIVWTVNDEARIRELIKSRSVDGIISDDGELLVSIARELHADRLDTQGHRGSRDLRPENTLPAMEAGLDAGVHTLETDIGITADGFPILSHDPTLNPQSCRKRQGEYREDALIHTLKLKEAQSDFVCNAVFRGEKQKNDPVLSPVARAFTKERGIDLYAPPTLGQLFDFVVFYERFYAAGDMKRAEAAREVRFNVETKIDPRFPERTTSPEDFVEIVAREITERKLESRVDIQSFDFRTLKVVQERYPEIRTVYLVREPALVLEPQVLSLFAEQPVTP